MSGGIMPHPFVNSSKFKINEGCAPAVADGMPVLSTFHKFIDEANANVQLLLLTGPA
jgi:hypothetical protein